jgi:lipoprotein-anchoring transpeptidase ErfK/SrfK
MRKTSAFKHSLALAASMIALSATGAFAFDRVGPTLFSPVQQASLGGDLSSTDLQREAAPVTHAVMADPTGEKPGTITVDTKNRYLYLSLDDGQAMRYDIGVGRDGFAWSGRAYVARHAEWPTWTPPAEMLKRRPDLPRFMKGGIDNPLGARAMYLYNGHGDTMYRIHGTNEPDTIGQAVSSGCIRLLNADVIDLYNRVKVGSAVNVI